MMNRADQFQQAFRNLQLQPLITEEDRRKFRVAYGEELLPELEQIITDCTNANNQLIFAGHRGCGKSTLLAELAQEIKDRYFMVFFSIADLIEYQKVEKFYLSELIRNYLTQIYPIALFAKVVVSSANWYGFHRNAVG